MEINPISSGMFIAGKQIYQADFTEISKDKDLFADSSYLKQLLSPNVPKAADSQINSINIEPGETRNIGNIDGIPLNICFDSYGMNTSFAAMVNVNEPANSPRNQLAADIFYSRTPEQIARAGAITSRFQLLYDVANGSMSINDFNEINWGKDTLSTTQLLKSLGIDTSKPFSFNGKSFYLDDQGDLHALLGSSPLNIL